jgi:hypothetical protein
MRIVSVGVPVVTDPAGGWNFWPLLTVPFTLHIAIRWLRFPLRLWVAVASLLVGLAGADAIGAWGVLPVATGAASVVAIWSMVLGQRHRDHPPPV